SFKGVPPYPLSKRLASTLLESINSKDICRSESGLKFFHEGSSLKQEENEWQKLVLDKESEIVNVSFKFSTEGIHFFRNTNLQQVLHRRERKDKWRSCNPCFESGCLALRLFGDPPLCKCLVAALL
ncbi:hypothetical protein CFP56_033221, partial [Quercus suber]